MPKGKPAMSPGERAKVYPKSAKLAIAAYCYHNCVGEESSNSHASKNFIKECKNVTCHLWPHRGWQKITGGRAGKVAADRVQKQPSSKA